jgi:hypothetical protein
VNAFERLDIAVERIAEVTRARPRCGRSHEDADDVAGTIDTDSAIAFDPRPLLKQLCISGARAVVMGQVAGILHGSTELTGDLDLLWDGDDGGAASMSSAFAAVCATLADQDGTPVACDPDAFLLPKVLFTSPSASGDCCTPKLPWGALDITGVIKRAESVVGPDGVAVRYVAARDLIAMRRAIDRPKDRRRADELEALLLAHGGRT